MPAGRPSLYRQTYCEEAISCLAQGYSLAAFAGTIGVTRQTVYEWQEVHPEFSDAVKVGQAKSAAWWEARLRKQSEANEGNVTATIFGLKNRARDDWSDMTRTEVTGKDGKDLLPADRELTRQAAFVLLNALRLTEKPPEDSQ